MHKTDAELIPLILMKLVSIYSRVRRVSYTRKVTTSDSYVSNIDILWYRLMP